MVDLQDRAVLNQAVELFKARRYDDAEALCRRLLAGDRRHVEALELVGQIERARGFVDEAAATFSKCIRLKPREPRHYVVLAGLRMEQGEYRRAVAAYEKALKVDPGNPLAVAGLADVYERRGEFDRARKVLAPFVESGRLDPAMGRVLATVELREKHYQQAVEVAQTHLAAPEVRPMVRRHLHFIQGEALEKLGRPDEAFEAYTAANRVIPVRFDHDDYVRKTEVLMSAFSAERLPELPRATNPSETPVFVVGMPRSGSTLVEKIIDAHPKGFGAGENFAMNRLVERLPEATGSMLQYPDCLEAATPAQLDRLGRQYLSDVARGGRNAKRIADKLLSNYRHLGLISRLFPEGRVIHCRRNPLDTCISCFTVRLDPIAHGFASDLRHCGLVYRNYARLMRHWDEVLDYPVLHVDYEELIADQEQVTRRIIEFCGLAWDEACLQFHKSARPAETLSYDQVRQPIYASSVGRAQRFERHLGPLMEALGDLA